MPQQIMFLCSDADMFPGQSRLADNKADTWSPELGFRVIRARIRCGRTDVPNLLGVPRMNYFWRKDSVTHVIR